METGTAPATGIVGPRSRSMAGASALPTAAPPSATPPSDASEHPPDVPTHQHMMLRTGAAPRGPCRVLLVEDDAGVAGALRAVLTLHGCIVTVAPTVARALQELRRSPHCVVLDLMLPDGC